MRISDAVRKATAAMIEDDNPYNFQNKYWVYLEPMEKVGFSREIHSEYKKFKDLGLLYSGKLSRTMKNWIAAQPVFIILGFTAKVPNPTVH